MKKKAILVLCALVLVYAASYAAFRQTHIKKWEKDGKDYVLFPKSQTGIYYFFRPAMYIDSRITRIGFHIGPHQ
jgi:hypothetical protein